MHLQLKVNQDIMDEIIHLYNHHGWELVEHSCMAIPDEDQFLWTIEATREQHDIIYYHVDLGANDMSIHESNVSAAAASGSSADVGTFVDLHIRVNAAQVEVVRKFMVEKGIEEVSETDNTVDNSSLNLPPGRRIEPKPGFHPCEYCLCQPCVTDNSNKQAWWGSESQSEGSQFSNALRRQCYYKFWTMLYHRGLWCNPIYLQQKQNAGVNPTSRGKSCQTVYFQ